MVWGRRWEDLRGGEGGREGEGNGEEARNSGRRRRRKREEGEERKREEGGTIFSVGWWATFHNIH